MSNQELYEIATIRIGSGETMRRMVRLVYVNWRAYTQKTTVAQRATLNKIRVELREAQPVKPRNKYPRLFTETTAELREAVLTHCQTEGIPLAQFVNNAVRAALRLAKE